MNPHRAADGEASDGCEARPAVGPDRRAGTRARGHGGHRSARPAAASSGAGIFELAPRNVVGIWCDARAVASIKEDSERLWQGQGDLVFADHPVAATHREGEEIAEGVLCLKSIASVNAVDTGDGLVMLDTGGEFDIEHRAPRDQRLAARRTRARRGLLPPPRGPRVRHEALRGGSDREGLAAARRVCARRPAEPLRSVHAHARLEHGHQQAPVRAARRRVPVARALPLSRRHLQGPVDVHARRPHVPPAPRPRRDRRRDMDMGARAQDRPPRRPLHLGGAERRQPAEGAALRLGLGRRRCRQMAGLEPELLLAGHGLPIFGADRVRAALHGHGRAARVARGRRRSR